MVRRNWPKWLEPLITCINASVILAIAVLVVLAIQENQEAYQTSHAIATAQKILFKESLADSTHGPTFMQDPDTSCDGDCNLAFSLIKRVQDKIYGKYIESGGDTDCFDDVDNYSELNRVYDGTCGIDITLNTTIITTALDEIKAMRESYKEGDNYAFVWEREQNGGYRNKLYFDNSIEEETASDIDPNMCSQDGKCDLTSKLDAIFNGTEYVDRLSGDSFAKNLQWILIEYPWIDPISQQSVTKRSLICRISEDFIIGSGWSFSSPVREPKQNMAYTILGGLVFVTGILFVYPGPYVKRTLFTMNSVVGCFFVSTLPLVIVGFVQGLRITQIKENDLTREELKEQDSVTRETSVGMALLALSITLMSGLVPEEKMNIVFSTVIAFVFSVASIMHLWKMESNDDMYNSKQLREFFLNMAIMNLLYAFVLVVVKYWFIYQLTSVSSVKLDQGSTINITD